MACGPSADQGDHDLGWLRSLRARAPAALRSSATGDGIGLPFPVGRLLPWEGLGGRAAGCLGGLWVRVEEGLAVLRRLMAIPQIGVEPLMPTISGNS